MDVGQRNEGCQGVSIYHSVALWLILNFAESGHFPLRGMGHRASANHIEIDVGQAAEQVLAGVHRGGMVAIFPECTVALFAPVVFLRPCVPRSTPSPDRLGSLGSPQRRVRFDK